jgi:hypothetical protein
VADTTIEVGLPTVEEVTRIIEAWFDVQPITTAYEVLAGDDLGIGEISPDDQRRVQGMAMRYWWLAAARKRLERPE